MSRFFGDPNGSGEVIHRKRIGVFREAIAKGDKIFALPASA